MSALLLALLCAAPADPVFTALDAEVTRAKALAMPPSPGSKAVPERPYFITASVTEETSFNAWASFGALQSRGGATRLVVGGRVRVGSPALDNTNFQDFGGLGLGEGGRRAMPAERDVDALRAALWLQLDDGYKAALEAFSRKRAFLETNQVSERLDDFGPAPVTAVLEPRATLEVDKDRWTQVVRRVSAVFLDTPTVLDSNVWFRALAATQSTVTTDPVRTRFGETSAVLQLAATAQASDGMELKLQRRFTGRTAQDLPPEAELLAAAKALAARTAALAKAQVAQEDYAGPVLFVDQAAALFFLQTVGEPLSNPREPLGAHPSGRLLDRLGKKVAARFISAKDDPTQRDWSDGRRSWPLWGTFPVDDDGVKPQPITLIADGTLKTHYMSRIPAAKLSKTNGHCRGEQGAPGNLFIETSQPTPRAALKQALVELAKDEDLDYGLMVEQAEEAVPRAWGNEGQRLSSPLLVWRVYADGREELVRGLTFKPLSQRVLKDVVAMGDDPSLLNLEHRGQRTSVVAPSVLVKLVELAKVKQDYEKPPLSPRP